MIVVLVVAGTGWFIWQRVARPSVDSGACRGCNFLLVTIDTLRVDRVGAFGGKAGLTPNLDRLANEGIRLTRAYAPAPLTLPSHTSILTAVSPPVHGVRTNGLFRLGPNLPTLATVLKASGYRTGAFVGAFVLDARFGLNRGFDVYDDRYGEKHPGDPGEGAERRGEDVIKPALAWIIGGEAAPGIQHQPPGTSHQAPFFAWIHLYDPHEPYRAPEPFASQHEPYDAEVAYADAMVGRLVEQLKAAGQLDHTLMMIAADHGESLGEHGERTHGVFVYDATLRVPWIIWGGARVPSGSSDALVRLIDLAPTALDLLGVASPDGFEGRSLLGVAARPEVPSTAYLEAMDANLTRNWAPLTGIVRDGYKFIELPNPELYDLRSDPRETTNLFARRGDQARTLGALLRGMTTGFAAGGSTAQKTTLSADARKRLQALGYVASSAEPGQRVYTDADDPKTLNAAANDLDRALGAFHAGSHAEAMGTVGDIIRRHPAFATAYGILASMQRDTGDLSGAIATLEDVVRRGIANQSVMLVLANYWQETGALERSAEVLQAVIASHPDYAEAYNSLGVVASRQRQHERARAAFAKVLELDPTSATAYENLGVDEIAAGDLDMAVGDLKHALELDPGLPGAHNALAAAYLRQRRSAEAIEQWKTAVQLDPHLYDALYNLGTVLYDSGRRDDARPYLQRFVTEAPPARYQQDIARIRKMLIR